MIRLFDILFSAIGLIILSPLFVILWLLIWMESKGPGLFVQERIGLNGKPFGLYKFRSMRRPTLRARALSLSATTTTASHASGTSSASTSSTNCPSC